MGHNMRTRIFWPVLAVILFLAAGVWISFAATSEWYATYTAEKYTAEMLLMVEQGRTELSREAERLKGREEAREYSKELLQYVKNHVKAGETVTLLSRRLQLSMTPDPALFDRYTKRIRFKDEKLGNILRVINLQNPDIQLETTPELWNRTLTVTFSNDTPEAMAELICLALDLKKTRQDNMILLFN